ncbi:MAG: PEP-CTERM sorting domain-containing protein [Phycisphaerae bacterium]|jgi:hypothetical protein
MLGRTKFFGVLAVAAIMAAGSVALADVELSDVIFQIQVTNDSGSDGYTVLKTDPGVTFDPVAQKYTWSMGAWFFDNGATLHNASLDVRVGNTRKRIGGAFSVQAGESTTTFEILFPQLTFDPPIPVGWAEGKMGLAGNVSDGGGGGGITMRALNPGAGMLRADYNGLVPAGTMFGEALYEIDTTNPSGSGYQNVPQSGYTDIMVPVADMSSRLAFTLTPTDIGGGTHYWEIVPEPASASLLVLGAVALLRLRR